MGSKNAKIQAYGKTVRQERDAEIEKWRKKLENRKRQLNISTKQEAKIIQSYAHELADMLNQGQVTSRQIVTVLAFRCTTVGAHYNFITEIDFQKADHAAQICDDQRRKTGKKNWSFSQEWDAQKYLPPLFGIPTSVKDYFDQEGKRSTLGITVRAHDIKEKDCGMISCLRTGGLIPFVRSNAAQATLSEAPYNHLYGWSKSVWNDRRSVGSSSSGEAGLLSSFCSPIGMGSDIGSVRNPAEFNGITSLKPCSQRFSTSQEYSTNIPDLLFGNDTVASVFGPMARSVEDLALWMKTTCDQRNHVDKDPYQKHVQFNANAYNTHTKKKLKIGVIKSLKMLEATPASQRVIDDVSLFLRKHGHEVVHVVYPLLDEVVGEYETWFLAEGGFKALDELFQGEQPTSGLKEVKSLQQSKVAYYIASCMTGCFAPRLQRSVQKLGTISTEQYCRHRSKVDKLRRSFVEWWKSLSLDNIVMPGYGCQSSLLDICEELSYASIYTFIWNLLNVPAGALPVSVVRQNEQKYESMHKDDLTKTLAKNAQGSEGLPVGIQVIGMPYEEERVLSLMKSIEKAFSFEKFRRVVSISNPE